MKSRIDRNIYDEPSWGIPTDKNVKIGKISGKAYNLISKELGFSGVMLFGSKTTGYDKWGKRFIPNANIFIGDGYKVWYGDIVLSLETLQKLRKVAEALKQPIFVLREHTGRFLDKVPDKVYCEYNAELVVDALGKISKNKGAE